MHPAGGSAATLSSEQGATHGLFARIDEETDPGEMRILRRALILDADGYETPIFSSDGRRLAIRGRQRIRANAARVRLSLASPRSGDESRRAQPGLPLPTRLARPPTRVAAFVDATSEIPHNANLEEHLEVTDGALSWNPENLPAVTTAADTDPMWLRHRAAINDLFSRADGRRD